MNVTIMPAALSGTLQVPSSKSMTHREIIAAALAEGKTKVTGVTWSVDIEATVRILSLLGAVIRKEEGKEGITLLIEGGLKKKEGPILADAGESGSTLRFLIPLGLLTENRMVYQGHGRLSERPLTPYYEIFEKKGISFHTEGGLPLEVEGRLEGGLYELPGHVSSQFFTGLLFALPLAEKDSLLKSSTPLESKSYVDMTVDTLFHHGIIVREEGDGAYRIPGRQRYKEGTFSVEGDYSQAAFWLTAALSGGDITLTGLSSQSLQGDKAIVSLYREMGGFIEEKKGLCGRKSELHGIVMDGENVPDLVPAFAAMAAVSWGTTEIIHAGRVRLKECDRLHAMAAELGKLGAHIEEKPEGLVIHGKPSLSGGAVSSWNDHRIAMALASITPRLTGPLTIEGAESVNKSYPRFWEDFESLGGHVEKTL
mgnify:CR=1 FL=1